MSQIHVVASVTPWVQEIAVGEPATFTCSSKKRVVWKFNSGNIQVHMEQKQYKQSSTLQINQVSIEDNGTYACYTEKMDYLDEGQLIVTGMLQ